MNPEDSAALARYRERKRQLEAELQAVKSIIDGFEALAALQSTQPADGGRDEAPTLTPAADEPDTGASSEAMTPVDPDVRMTAKDATLRIYGENPGAYRAGHIANEISRRGWVIDSVRPEQAVRTAILRLVEAGYLERVGHGLYSLAEADNGSDRSQSNGADEPTNSPTSSFVTT